MEDGMRPEGSVLFDDSLTTHPVVEDAKRSQKQLQDKRKADAAARANRPLLNKHTYPELYARWVANHGGLLPKCRRCRDYVIHWDEPAHVCPGYTPQFVERSPEEWQELELRRRERQRERWEEQREAIREAKANGTFYYQGDEDGPEEDYCEGDDDGYDCEDDGDPMWD
jgi:hypothetical protein